MSALPSRPAPVVLAAPSGTGKTTIAHALVEGSDRFVFSVSATTRPPRRHEVEGKDYEFVSEEVFRRMIAAGELAEWAEVHGHLYGTPRRNLDRAAEQGRHPVLDIDVQGAGQIRRNVPEAILVFVFPPTADALLRRLRVRGTEDPAELRRRLEAAGPELEQAKEFDYIVVNDDLAGAVSAVRAIIDAEAHRPSRSEDLAGRVSSLRRRITEVVSEKL